MAKKRAARRAGEDNDDSASYASSATNFSNNMTVEQELLHSEAELFASAIDDTYESRGTTREAAWERMCTMLRGSVRADDCCQNAATLVGRALVSLRKGGAVEAAAAATALGLHLMTVAEQDERLFAEVQPDLMRVAKSGKTPAARVAGIEALAVVCFCCSDDPQSTVDTMEQLQAMWQPGGSPKVRAASMRAWSFLYTSLRHAPPSAALQPLLPGLAAALHDADSDVRGAAGEALALAYHTNPLAAGGSSDDEWDSEDEEGGGEEEEEEDEGRGGGGASASGASSELSGLEDVVDRMRELATNRGEALRRKKRDKRALRAVFRELCRTLQGESVPVTKVRLRYGDVLVVDTLAGNVTLAYLRRFLGTGFQPHLQYNPLMHAVFDLTPLEEPAERMSAAEKRAYRSTGSVHSKARAQDRKTQRANKAAGMCC